MNALPKGRAGAALALLLALLTAEVVEAEAQSAGIPDSLVVFISDTQSPIWWETLALEQTNNEGARELIFKDILDHRPNAVVHLGDLVSIGFLNSTWDRMDAFLGTLRGSGVSFYPTLGNHELFLLSSKGEKEFLKRFPWYVRTGYVKRFGQLAVVILNSNFSFLSKAEQAAQQVWYEQTLAELDQDSTAEMIIVGCHHSPYTNNTVVAPSEEVRDHFVKPFLASIKARVFISGHAHAYEHFQEGGKDFLVVGGGGGLLHPLLQGPEARWRDLYEGSGPTRMFHYALCRFRSGEVQIRIKMLKPDFSGFIDADSLDFSLATPKSAAKHH